LGTYKAAWPARTDATLAWQAVSTGQLNTILTFYEVQYPEIPSELSDVPMALLRRAIDVLRKTNRAQIIESAEGGGVRFFGGG